MTGLFFDISDYIPDDEEMAVDSAIAKLKLFGVAEEYDIVPSMSNYECFDMENYNRRVRQRVLGNF